MHSDLNGYTDILSLSESALLEKAIIDLDILSILQKLQYYMALITLYMQ